MPLGSLSTTVYHCLARVCHIFDLFICVVSTCIYCICCTTRSLWNAHHMIIYWDWICQGYYKSEREKDQDNSAIMRHLSRNSLKMHENILGAVHLRGWWYEKGSWAQEWFPIHIREDFSSHICHLFLTLANCRQRRNNFSTLIARCQVLSPQRLILPTLWCLFLCLYQGINQ